MTSNFGKIIALLSLASLSSIAAADDAKVHNDARPENLTHYSKRPITQDVMYFVLPDRFNNADKSNDKGGIDGTRDEHGYDITSKGFYHGGDLKGLTAKLDYLADMGISAIWMTPIFKNLPTQPGIENQHSAYHGYWITDFTQIDPHLGTNDDLKQLIVEAHKRNMKVIFDIIVNHTADVIKYRECYSETDQAQGKPIPNCAYRSLTDYPDKGYTPYVLDDHKNIKVPAWLNDMKYYTNRGDSEWKGESSIRGDFAGLDDLNTYDPDVVKGFIDIFKHWISEYKFDGYRIDTVKHVNIEFWQEFSPAIINHAKAEGIDHFYMFGEVAEFGREPKSIPPLLSHFTAAGKLPAVLDFGFQAAALGTITKKGPMTFFEDVYSQDSLFDNDYGDAQILPTFLGNHDNGRLGYFLRNENPDMSDEDLLKRSKLAHAIMYFSRGVPVVYYGDEQGFTGDGHDQDAREDMFESQVASYNDNKLIGSKASTADNNFDPAHPLYKSLQHMAATKSDHPALNGGRQEVLYADDEPGLLLIKRSPANNGDQIIAIYNSSVNQKATQLSIDLTGHKMCPVAGQFGDLNINDETIKYNAPALSWALYKLAASCDQAAG